MFTCGRRLRVALARGRGNARTCASKQASTHARTHADTKTDRRTHAHTDRIAVEAVEAPLDPDHDAGDRAARNTGAQAQREAAAGQHVTGGNVAQFRREIQHGGDVRGGGGRLRRGVEGRCGAGAGDNVPLADVLILEEARAGDDGVEVGEDAVELAQERRRRLRAQRLAGLEGAEEDERRIDIGSDELAGGAWGLGLEPCEHVQRDEAAKQAAVARGELADVL